MLPVTAVIERNNPLPHSHRCSTWPGTVAINYHIYLHNLEKYMRYPIQAISYWVLDGVHEIHVLVGCC